MLNRKLQSETASDSAVWCNQKQKRSKDSKSFGDNTILTAGDRSLSGNQQKELSCVNLRL